MANQNIKKIKQLCFIYIKWHNGISLRRSATECDTAVILATKNNIKSTRRKAIKKLDESLIQCYPRGCNLNVCIADINETNDR